MYYDLVISEVRKCAEAGAVTLYQRLVFGSDFMRPDLVPHSRNSEEAHKSQILCGAQARDGHLCVRVCVCVSSRGV